MKRLSFLLCVFLVACSSSPSAEPEVGTSATSPILQSSYSKELLRDLRIATALGGEWFLHRSDPNGSIHYKYLPNQKRESTDNNELRKMASAWSIGKLHEFTGDERYAALARRSLRHFEKIIVQSPDSEFTYVDYIGKTKLGYSAFLILTLSQLDEYPNREHIVEGLVKGLLHQQQEDGSFRTYFFSDRNTGTDFYPGEANLALMNHYERTGDKRAFEAVKKSFPYYREYWRNKKGYAFIPWQTQAFVKLYEAEPRGEYKNFVFEMNDYILGGQMKEGTATKPEYVGGFHTLPGISTSSYLEGLHEALRLAILVGDEQRTKTYSEASAKALQFLLTLQFTEEQKFGLIELNEHTLGGFRQSLENGNLRVDNNQHALMAMIQALELVEE